MSDSDVVYELPGQRTSRVARFILCVMSPIAALSWASDCFSGGWSSVLGLFGLWLSGIGMCFGILPSVGLTSRSPNSCLVNCAAVCLSHLGYSFDAGVLEQEMRLNKFVKGTRIQDFLQFLSNKSIVYLAFSCHDVTELRMLLTTAKSPMIALVGQPILHCAPGWKLLFAPFALTSSLLQWLRKSEVSHAIVVYGVTSETVLVYDPAYGTLHRVTWLQLSSWLMPHAFLDGKFLALSKPEWPSFPDTVPIDLTDQSSDTWDTTF